MRKGACIRAEAKWVWADWLKLGRIWLGLGHIDLVVRADWLCAQPGPIWSGVGLWWSWLSRLGSLAFGVVVGRREKREEKERGREENERNKREKEERKKNRRERKRNSRGCFGF